MAFKTITIKGDGVRNERQANGTITPGHLLVLQSTGKVVVHASAGNVAQKMVAVEDDLQGKEITDNYTTGNRVQYNVFRPGDVFLGILADGQNASIGSFLESNANGELRVYAADSAGAVEYPNSIVGQAITAVNASDSAATAVASRRIQVEVM